MNYCFLSSLNSNSEFEEPNLTEIDTISLSLTLSYTHSLSLLHYLSISLTLSYILSLPLLHYLPLSLCLC